MPLLVNSPHRSARALVAGLALAAAACLVSSAAMANPYFAQKTGRACKSCHMPGMETAGLQGLNETGKEFDRAFREDPVRALRDYAGGIGGPAPAPRAAPTCSAKFLCSADFAMCYFRLFRGDRSTNTFTVPGGERRKWNVFYDAEYCVSHTGFPGAGCDRIGVRKFCD